MTCDLNYFPLNLYDFQSTVQSEWEEQSSGHREQDQPVAQESGTQI